MKISLEGPKAQKGSNLAVNVEHLNVYYTFIYDIQFINRKLGNAGDRKGNADVGIPEGQKCTAGGLVVCVQLYSVYSTAQYRCTVYSWRTSSLCTAVQCLQYSTVHVYSVQCTVYSLYLLAGGVSGRVEPPQTDVEDHCYGGEEEGGE